MPMHHHHRRATRAKLSVDPRGARARRLRDGRSGASATLSDSTYHYPLLTVARPAPRASRDALAVARRADVFGANLHGTGFTFRAADAKGAGLGPLRALPKARPSDEPVGR